jgi:2-amino-4-hydroxy-6-hydroxymethyldihydropteridine diphosphokinase
MLVVLPMTAVCQFEEKRAMPQETVRGKIGMNSPFEDNLALIALGSNVGFGGRGPGQVLDWAFEKLEAGGFAIRERSRKYATPAFPAGAGPDFVNAAAVVQTHLDAAAFLAQLHEVEALMGRERTLRWGARTLDIDLVALGARVLPDAESHQYWRELPLHEQKTNTPQELILPHPRLAERGFVLVPLMDVAPQWCHPVTGLSVRQMHDQLPQHLRDEVVAL